MFSLVFAVSHTRTSWTRAVARSRLARFLLREVCSREGIKLFVLHGITVVAELKPVKLRENKLLGPILHGTIAVAELKPQRPPRGYVLDACDDTTSLAIDLGKFNSVLCCVLL
jgi:hypothetical protein